MRSNLVDVSMPPAPPSMERLPSCQWILDVYFQDILERLGDVKAAVTSIFGSVLKMDSTKKVTKKLAGKIGGTASWATNVSNEFGQVLTSVLTSHKGEGLKVMLQGLQSRYAGANVVPPVVLYVDHDCCSGKMREVLQPHWADTQVRLDIWHFMRRIATAVNTISHQLYPSFMSRLSKAIFVWDDGDVKALAAAKKSQIEAEGFRQPSDSDVQRRISCKELALHCRRSTRGTEETERLLDELLTVYTSEQGKDKLGVPLLNSEQAWQVWEEQKRHVRCLQDPPGISLYTITGERTVGSCILKTYRCARGFTSLESFHLHLNRFIPGQVVNDVHYQAYLLEGLARWNQDRQTTAVQYSAPARTATSELARQQRVERQARTYSGKLQQHINQLSMAVYGTALMPDFVAPRQYTGELFGVEYLLRQNAETLVDCMDPCALQMTNEMEEDSGADDGLLDDEEIMEEEVDHTVFTVFEERPGRALMETNLPSRQEGLRGPARKPSATVTRPSSSHKPSASMSASLESPRTAEEPLPPASQPPQHAAFGAGDDGSRHQYHLPVSTAGTAMARTWTKKQLVPVAIAPRPSKSGPCEPASTSVTVPVATAAEVTIRVSNTYVPRSTKFYRKRRLEEQLSGENVKLYKRHKAFYTCRLCQQPRTEKHLQYYGSWWCEDAAARGLLPSLPDWREEQRARRIHKKGEQSATSAP